MNVAMPEFDGRIITVPICFKETVQQDPRIGGAVSRYVPDDERVRMLAGLALRWAGLPGNRARKNALLSCSATIPPATRASATPWAWIRRPPCLTSSERCSRLATRPGATRIR